MSRLKLSIAVLLLLIIVTGVGAAFTYFVFYPKYKTEKVLELAEGNMTNGNWSRAQTQFGWYATKYPQRIDVLEKYIECNFNILRNRRVALQRIAQAYTKLARQRPEDQEHREKAFAFDLRYEFWEEIEILVRIYSPNSQERSAKYSYLMAVAADRLGRSAEALDKYEELIPRYDELIEANQVPRNIFLGAARILLKQGFEASAEQVFAQASEYNGYEADPHFRVQHAGYLLEIGEQEAAKIEMDEVLAEHPAEELGYDALILACQIENEFNNIDAIGTLAEQARELDPDLPRAYFHLAQFYDYTGQTQEAISLLEGLSDEFLALYTRFYSILAELQLQVEDVTGAEKTAQTVKEILADGDIFYEYVMARIDLQEGKFTEAQEVLSRLALLAPTFDEAKKYLFFAYLGIWDTLQHDNETTLTSGNPNENNQSRNPDTYFQLAKSTLHEYLLRRTDDEFMRTQEIKIFEEDPETGKDAARSLLSQFTGDNSHISDFALKLLTQLRVDNSRENEIALMLGELSQSLIESGSTDATTYNYLVQALLAQGRMDDAELTYEEATDTVGSENGLELSNAAIELAKGQIELAEGHTDIALEHSQEAEQLRNTAAESGETYLENAQEWAYLFARYDNLDEGLECLRLAAEIQPDEIQIDFLLKQVDLTAEFGTLTDAYDLLRSMENDPLLLPSDDLINSKISLAQRFLQSTQTESTDGSQIASSLISELKAIAPNMPKVRLLVGQLNLFSNPPQLSAALASIAGLNSAGQPRETRVQALTLMHDIAIRRGEYAEALKFIREAQRINRGDLSIVWALCKALYQNGNYVEAISWLNEFLVTSPQNFDALALLVQTYASLDMMPEAQYTLTRLQEAANGIEEYAPRLTSLEGWLKLQRGAPADAEAALRASYSQSPHDYEIVSRLARCVFSQRNSGVEGASDKGLEAIELLREFALTNKENAQVWYLMGMMYRELAKEATSKSVRDSYFRESVETFAKATVIEPDYSPAILGIVSSQQELGELGTASGLLDKQLARENDSTANRIQIEPEFYYARALIAADTMGQNEQALYYIDKAIARCLEEGYKIPMRYYVARGAILIGAKKFEDALADFQKALSDPRQANAGNYANAAIATLAIIEQAIIEQVGLSEAESTRYTNNLHSYIKAARNKNLDGNTAIENTLLQIEKKLTELLTEDETEDKTEDIVVENLN